MRRLLVILLTVFLVSLVFTEVVLNMVEVFTWPERTQVLKEIIKKFEEEHPGVKINLISPPYETAYQKVYTMISTRQPVDIVEVGDWSLSTLAAMGGLENLEPYIKDWERINDLLPGLLDSARIYKGVAYIVPTAVYVKTLYIRNDVLAKYGITKAPSTMLEMYGMARYITDPKKAQYGFNFRGKGFPTDFIDLVVTSFFDDIDPKNKYLTKDGKIIWSDPRAKLGLELYVKLYKDTAPKDAINWGFSEQVNAFSSGMAPILFQDPDTLGILRGSLKDSQFSTAPLPVGPSGKAYPHFGFSGFGIVSYSKHKDIAWEFIKFFYRPDILAYWCKNYGVLPPDKTLYEKDPYFKSEKYAGWKYMFEHPEKYQFTQLPIWNKKWSEWNELQEKTMQKVLLGRMSIDEVLKLWTEFWEEAGIK